MASLEDFVLENKIQGGSFVGIGAVQNTKLGVYQQTTKGYKEHIFSECLELLNITGTVSWLDEKPVIHAHVTLCGEDYKCMGGHLIETEVAVTAEISMTVTKSRIERSFDEDTNLNLLDLL
jgi:uncharacterized protein